MPVIPTLSPVPQTMRHGELLDVGSMSHQEIELFIRNFRASNGYWSTVSDAWKYASASTISVPNGAASIYSVGDAVRFIQAGALKQFYVTGVSAALLTVTAGADFTVANAAISLPAFSKSRTPSGFPGTFALGTPTWTTSGAAFTNQPTANTYKLSINGREVLVTGQTTLHATSGGTGSFTATFPTGQLPVSSLAAIGTSLNISTGVEGWVYVGGGVNTLLIGAYNAGTLATNSQVFVITARWLI